VKSKIGRRNWAGPLVAVVGLGTVTVIAGALAVQFENTGVVTVIATSGVILVGLLAWIAYQFLTMHDRDHQLRARQNEIDLVRLQGDLVAVLKDRYERAVGRASPEEVNRLQVEFNDATERYQAILGGLLKARTELADVERIAIGALLDEAANELQRMDGAQAAWSR
jgi:signal transduction histidine kinase